MVSVDLTYRTLQFLVNTVLRGNVAPTDIRSAINLAVNEMYEEYISEINRAANRENRGLINGGLENLTDRQREKLLHFLKETTLTYSDNAFVLPADYRYFDSVYYLDNNEIEGCKSAQEFKQLSNYVDTAPTLTYPIYLKLTREVSGEIQEVIRVAPSIINDDVSMFYLRSPKVANWTFTVVDDTELFNPDAEDFQDIDLHDSEFANVVRRTSVKLGINLKEDDLQAAMQQAEAQNYNSENAS